MNALAIGCETKVLSVSVGITDLRQNRLYGIAISSSNCSSSSIFLGIADNKRRDSRAPVVDNYEAAAIVSWTCGRRDASIDAVSV